MTGFYMKYNTGLKWVKRSIFKKHYWKYLIFSHTPKSSPPNFDSSI